MSDPKLDQKRDLIHLASRDVSERALRWCDGDAAGDFCSGQGAFNAARDNGSRVCPECALMLAWLRANVPGMTEHTVFSVYDRRLAKAREELGLDYPGETETGT